MSQKLKIFGHAWHTPHQYSLMTALPEFQFFYIRNRIKQWADESRPMPPNLFFVDHYEPGEYDLAILHIDQQCLFDERKSTPYRMLNEQIQDIPKIVINHGTPHYGSHKPEDIKQILLQKLGTNTMVVNSKQAAKEWGVGTPIIHGLSGEDFKPAKQKQNRIITTLTPNYQPECDGWRDYYNRELFEAVREKIDIVHIGHDVKFKSYEEYREYVAESLIYFNPTRHSPMPRSRTEAMLSGCAVVSTPSHDWGKYIENGENGILINGDDVQEAVRALKYLQENQENAKAIGEAGRTTALREFDTHRYREEWLQLIRHVTKYAIVDADVRRLKTEVDAVVKMAAFGNVSKESQLLIDSAFQRYSAKLKNAPLCQN